MSFQEYVVPSPGRTVVRPGCGQGESRRDCRTVSVCVSTRVHALYSGERPHRRLLFYLTCDFSALNCLLSIDMEVTSLKDRKAVSEGL